MANKRTQTSPSAPYHSDIHEVLSELSQSEGLELRVSGGCMSPLIENGAMIQLRSSSRYWPGDILVVRNGSGQYSVHRLLGGYRKGGRWRLVTKGDNNLKTDIPFVLEACLGKVCAGDCAAAATAIPLLHRLHAIREFIRLVLKVLLRRRRAS